MDTQLPGTVFPESVVIYEFLVGGERVMHVAVTGIVPAVEYEAPPGVVVKYLPATEHWFMRMDAVDALLDGNEEVCFRVRARGTPASVKDLAKEYQADSRLQFRARGELSKPDWTRGKPSSAPAEFVTLEGLEPRSQRNLTLRLEIKRNVEKLTRVVWHSKTNSPAAFFDGDPELGDEVELNRITNDPWASGNHYYFAEVETPD